MTNLWLASASPRRRELLALLGLPFEGADPGVSEAVRQGESPAQLVSRLSQEKARAAVGRGNSLVVACDTVVALGEELLGKPRDADEASAMLSALRDRSHSVHSGITLLDTATGRMLTDVVETRVLMRAYHDAEIAAYVASGDPMDKAGAYAIQHAGFHPVSDLQGCYANVVGFPICHLASQLRRWDIELPRNVPAACQAHTGRCCAVYRDILPDE